MSSIASWFPWFASNLNRPKARSIWDSQIQHNEVVLERINLLQKLATFQSDQITDLYKMNALLHERIEKLEGK